MGDLENLELATGARGAQDIAALLPKKIARDMNAYIAEQAWGRRLFTINRDLVGATGLSITYPLKEKSLAMRVSDMGEFLNGQGEVTHKTSETFMVGARAQWSYAMEKGGMVDFMTQEVIGALDAIAAYENRLVYDRCARDVAAENAFAAATPGSFAYGDLLKLRKLVKGPMDYVVIHPTQMADVLADERFIRGDFITRMDGITPATTEFRTRIGVTFLETEEAEDGTVIGVNSRRAGMFTIKQDATQLEFDLGKATGGMLFKGVSIWELIDAIVLRGDSVAKCAV